MNDQTNILLLVTLLVGILLIFWIFWKARRLVWFLALFFGVVLFYVIYHWLLGRLETEYPWLGPSIIVFSIALTAFKFARKNTKKRKDN